jgi:hypothetical protein
VSSKKKQEQKNELKLTIELVPKTSWCTNLRSMLTSAEWEQCKTYSKKISGNVCMICGGVGDKWKTECHEVWEYDDLNNIQSLKCIMALCPKCHEVKHIGLANINGHYQRTFNHFKTINELEEKDAKNEIEKTFWYWGIKSLKEWKIDVSFLKKLIKEKEINLSKDTLDKLKIE